SMLGVLGFILATFVYGLDIGIVIGPTLLLICTMSATVGGLMPILAKTIGADPAVFSNPIISTFCDATGPIIYFLIATSVLGLTRSVLAKTLKFPRLRRCNLPIRTGVIWVYF